MVTKRPRANQVRLHIDLSESSDRELDRLATVAGVPKTDVIRHGLAMIKVAIDERAKGHTVGIVDEEGKLVTRIKGL